MVHVPLFRVMGTVHVVGSGCTVSMIGTVDLLNLLAKYPNHTSLED